MRAGQPRIGCDRIARADIVVDSLPFVITVMVYVMKRACWHICSLRQSKDFKMLIASARA